MQSRAPLVEHDHHAQKRCGIEQKIRSCAEPGNKQSTKRGARSTRKIEVDAVQRDGSSELIARHEVRDDCLPGRSIECCADSEHEAEPQDGPRARSAEDGYDPER